MDKVKKKFGWENYYLYKLSANQFDSVKIIIIKKLGYYPSTKL